MNMLYQRGLAAVAAAVTLGAVACSEHPRDASDAVADTMTTPTMRRALSSDFRDAEQSLQLAEDSVYNALGPELAIRLQPLREAFVTYRKQQCERLKAVFKGGTYGPVAELECLIHLTDSRHEFIEKHHDLIKKIGDRGGGRANPMATPTMQRALSSDFRVAEQSLQKAEDSVDNALGPDLAIRLEPLREAFVTYRKQQCERAKAVFKDGTYGPVAELECLIHLTDSRREFIEERYDFIEKIGGRGVRKGRANPARGAARKH